MDMTRRGFVGSLAAAVTLPGIGKDDDWFEDIRVDRYYTLQGGQYGDTGGWGSPGYMMAPEYINYFGHLEHCRELEDRFEIVEQRGFYLTPSSYFGEKWRRYDRIYLTKSWLTEFYKRHKGETFNMWKERYDKYIADLKSRGWRLVNGKFCNPDVGVD